MKTSLRCTDNFDSSEMRKGIERALKVSLEEKLKKKVNVSSRYNLILDLTPEAQETIL